MNSLEYVRTKMRVVKENNKWQLEIKVDFNFATDCPLSVNTAPMNSGDPGFRIPEWLATNRFVSQMMEVFETDVRRKVDNRRHQGPAIVLHLPQSETT
jgi:hypothetical protein